MNEIFNIEERLFDFKNKLKTKNGDLNKMDKERFD